MGTFHDSRTLKTWRCWSLSFQSRSTFITRLSHIRGSKKTIVKANICEISIRVHRSYVFIQLNAWVWWLYECTRAQARTRTVVLQIILCVLWYTYHCSEVKSMVLKAYADSMTGACLKNWASAVKKRKHVVHFEPSRNVQRPHRRDAHT
jgi:hypothetical protein